MIEVKMTDDIRKRDTKAVGPFSFRQIVCIIIGASYAVPIAVAIPADITVKILIGLVLASPAALCGFIRLNREPFEIVLIRWVYKHLLTPCKRKTKSGDPYFRELKRIRTRKEMKSNGKKKKEVTYSGKKSLKVYR